MNTREPLSWKHRIRSALQVARRKRWWKEYKEFKGRLPAPSFLSSKEPQVCIVTLTAPDSTDFIICRDNVLRNTRYGNWQWIVASGARDDFETQSICILEKWVQGKKVEDRQRHPTLHGHLAFTFASLNNAVTSLAPESDYYLFLNDDVFVGENWLSSLVDACENNPSLSVASPVLFFPFIQPPFTEFPVRPGCPDNLCGTVQHEGVVFKPTSEFAQLPDYRMPVNLAEHSLLDLPAEPLTVPAVSAACMLVRREDFETLGGFDSQFEWGLEDIDFCLRVREQKSGESAVVVVPRSIGFHNESSTRRRQKTNWIDESRERNHRLFFQRWNKEIRKQVVQEKCGKRQRFFCAPGEAQLHFVLACTSTSSQEAYGDSIVAAQLAKALEKLGHRVQLLEQRPVCKWYAPQGHPDVYISLVDKVEIERLKDLPALKVGWIRNHIPRWFKREDIHEYDLLLGSSPTTARIIQEKLSALKEPENAPEVDVLMLAADTDRFTPEGQSLSPQMDLAFIGSYWNEPRSFDPLLEMDKDFSFAIFGKRWDLVPQCKKYWRGFVPPEKLPMAYRSCRVVVDDHHEGTRPFGCINLRIFEAFATGRPVITNGCAGIEQVFSEGLYAFEDPNDIPRLIQRIESDLKNDPSLPERLRRGIEEHHTFDQRARELCETAGRILNSHTS